MLVLVSVLFGFLVESPFVSSILVYHDLMDRIWLEGTKDSHKMICFVHMFLSFFLFPPEIELLKTSIALA